MSNGTPLAAVHTEAKLNSLEVEANRKTMEATKAAHAAVAADDGNAADLAAEVQDDKSLLDRANVTRGGGGRRRRRRKSRRKGKKSRRKGKKSRRKPKKSRKKRRKSAKKSRRRRRKR